MKITENSGKIALIALAAVCLFAAPALSMSDSCQARMGHGGMFPMMNNLTAEEMGNMTLGELKEMQRQAWNNTTACLAQEPGQNCSQMGRDANSPLGMKEKGMGEMGRHDDQMKGGFMDKRSERNGALPGKDDNRGQCGGALPGMRGASPILLLMDDLTVADLGNMTINQVKDLFGKKMQELDNMTLNQIKQLQENKMQARNNLTLNQLKEENKNMWQMARMLGVAGSGCHNKA